MTIAEDATVLPSLKQTTCAYCGVGCGIDIELNAGNPVKLIGTPEHPANYGRLCVKGSHLLTTTGEDNRLLQPEVDGVKVPWELATKTVADKFNHIIKKHGKEAVAFYVSGQLLTEDYYVANKLMKGYIGTGNIDTNSRLCMSSAVSAYKRAFGEDVVPCSYSDIEQTDLMIFIGSNAAWTHPVLFQRLERAQKQNPNLKIVVIDPRKTATAESADIYLPLKSGTDAALFNGLLKYLSDNNALDDNFIDNNTEQFEETLHTASPWSIQQVAKYCELSIKDVTDFYEMFCRQQKVISFYSMGINQSSSGADKCNAIINVHLASGKLAKNGCGPFSITGQPNAMGGREVGGLANQLAAHLDIENPKHRSVVKRYWQSPKIASKNGLKAIDLFDEIESGKIKAVWIMATNPVVSLPNREKVERALSNCEFVVVSDCVEKNDTLAFADVKLPATTWLEKNGTVTNSERCISRQRGIVEAKGSAKHDWQIICDVAKSMGFSGFDFSHPGEIFKEHAGLTAFENDSDCHRLLNLSGLTDISIKQYDAFSPKQWPITKESPTGISRVFASKTFSTPSGKAQFIPIKPASPKHQLTQQFPLTLNSGRLRDQWHTMTRTGKSALLNRHVSKPFVSINSVDAKNMNIKSGQLVRLNSNTTTDKITDVVVPAMIDNSVAAGQCFMPIHWNEQFASSANVNALYMGFVDPISGQAELKQAAVNIQKILFKQYANIYISNEYELIDNITDYWLKTQMAECVSIDCAFNIKSDDSLAWCQGLAIQDKQGSKGLSGEWIKFSDDESGTHHLLCIEQGIVKFAAYISHFPIAKSYQWVDELIGKPLPEFSQIQSLLNGISLNDFASDETICSCFNVGAIAINDEIAKTKGQCSVDSLGAKLKCGTNCGSCKPEIKRLIGEYVPKQELGIDDAVTSKVLSDNIIPTLALEGVIHD